MELERGGGGGAPDLIKAILSTAKSQYHKTPPFSPPHLSLAS